MLIQDLEELDRILDELEALARSDLETAEFLPIFLDRLRLTLDAIACAFVIPLGNSKWEPIASSGDFVNSDQLESLLTRLGTTDPSQSSASQSDKSVQMNVLRAAPDTTCVQWLTQAGLDYRWIAVPIKPSNPAKGCLLVSVNLAIPESSLSGIVEVVSAFAELLAIKQSSDLESFLDRDWRGLQQFCRQLAEAESIDEASLLLANRLAHILRCPRVTVATRSSSKSVAVRAVSGIPSISEKTPLIRQLRQFGQQALRDQRPFVVSPAEEPCATSDSVRPGLFPHAVCLPLGGEAWEGMAQTAIVIEYETCQGLRAGLGLLSELLPIVGLVWDQQCKWLRLPPMAKRLTTGSVTVTRTVAAIPKWLVSVGTIGLLAWCLCRPYPLMIQAAGFFEPARHRAVFASADGYVEELLVQDGEAVQSDTPLARLRAPDLEMLIERAEGEMRAAEEEANSVRIAINQLDPGSHDALESQSRLASKIEQVETRGESLRAQLKLLRQQQERLTLVSPMNGVVVAKDLWQNLYRRPVRRGDALFSVADLSGSWQLRLQVADRDFGYVRQHFGVSANQQWKEIEFAFDRSPAKRETAHIEWMAGNVENRHGEGSYVEVRATACATDSGALQAGAGVTAYFRCGQQPLWFIWCRPFIEAAQRRMWLGNGEKNT